MAIQETSFGPKRYLAIRKTIPVSKVTDKQMYDEAGRKLGEYIESHAHEGLKIVGPWSVIYFTWDMEKKETDMAIAFPVEGLVADSFEGRDDSSDQEFSAIDLPESKASMDTMVGSYEGLADMHQSLMDYSKEKGYSLEGKTDQVAALAVEEYTVGPMQDSDPENWRTDIYYLHA